MLRSASQAAPAPGRGDRSALDLVAPLGAPDVRRPPTSAKQRRVRIQRERLTAYLDTQRVDQARRGLVARLMREIPDKSPHGLDANWRVRFALRSRHALSEVDDALQLMVAAGWGHRREAGKTESGRAGAQYEKRLGYVEGLTARSIAARFPHTSDPRRKRRGGQHAGEDMYGRISFSHTLDDKHLGIVFAVTGVWDARGRPEAVRIRDGEIIWMLTGDPNPNGERLRAWRRAVTDLSELTITCEQAAAGFVLKERPFDVCRDGKEWVFTPRPWYREELAGKTQTHRGHSVFNGVRLSLHTWCRLGGPARRLYAFVQSWGLDKETQRGNFFTGDKLSFTLGLPKRHGDMIDSLRHSFDQLSIFDRRFKFLGDRERGRGRVYGNAFYKPEHDFHWEADGWSGPTNDASIYRGGGRRSKRRWRMASVYARWTPLREGESDTVIVDYDIVQQHLDEAVRILRANLGFPRGP